MFRFRRKIRATVQKEVLNNLQSVFAEDPCIKVPEFCGEFFVDPRSDLFKRMVLYFYYEPNLVGAVLHLLDVTRDAVDIGANIGFYSVLLAKKISQGNRVLAIEPSKNALSRLWKNIDRNKVGDKVIVVPGILSNSSGKSVLHVIPGREEYSTVGPVMHPSVKGSDFLDEEVDAFTLDELVSHYQLNPGFVKLDVEGGESMVLDGATNTLTHCRPVILSELSDSLLRLQGSSAIEVVGKFRSVG